jgi:hypothetical protein
MTDEYDIPESEKEDLSEDGYDAATQFDAEAAYRAARIFDEHGYTEKASEMLSIGETAVNFWVNTIFDLTGREVYFNETTMRWHDSGTGQFIRDPYSEIKQDQYEFEMYIINTYG